MKKILQRLNTRQIVLSGIAGASVVCALIVQHCFLPAYDEWKQTRSLVLEQFVEHARLKRNLAIKQSVARQFEALGPQAYQSESDEVTVSRFLRTLETLARHPTITVNNTKPLPVQNNGTHKIYKVKLSVAGKVQEIVQFVSALMYSEWIVGLEAFQLRGVQGHNMIECSLSVWMVRLIPVGAVAPPAKGTSTEAM